MASIIEKKKRVLLPGYINFCFWGGRAKVSAAGYKSVYLQTAIHVCIMLCTLQQLSSKL